MQIGSERQSESRQMMHKYCINSLLQILSVYLDKNVQLIVLVLMLYYNYMHR